MLFDTNYPKSKVFIVLNDCNCTLIYEHISRSHPCHHLYTWISMKHEAQTYKEIFTHSSYSWFSIPQTHKQYLTYPDMNQLSSNEMFTTIGRQTVLGKKERKLWDSMHHSFLPGICWLEAKYIHINESRVDKQVFDVDQLLTAFAMWAGICV